MREWTKTLIAPETSIRDALAQIDLGEVQIALVVDADRVLQGVVTDGDVRRGILRGIALEDSVERIMNRTPITISDRDDRAKAVDLMRETLYHQIPVVNEAGQVVGLEVIGDLLIPQRRTNPVVLMAGGLGTRLQPLTDDCPKPLLKVGGKPILETILESLAAFGFHRFYLSVNYRAEMIEAYFGNGDRWNVSIEYLREDRRLGTAGSLSLLPAPPQEPVLVMNGDLMTKLDFAHLMEYHRSQQALATMCVREYDVQVPYGVVETQEQWIVSIKEKPIQRFFVNAGVYVLEPEALRHLPHNAFFDMTDLFGQLTAQEGRTAVFPVRESWMDVGQMQDYLRANGEHSA